MKKFPISVQLIQSWWFLNRIRAEAIHAVRKRYISICYRARSSAANHMYGYSGILMPMAVFRKIPVLLNLIPKNPFMPMHKLVHGSLIHVSGIFTFPNPIRNIYNAGTVHLLRKSAVM